MGKRYSILYLVILLAIFLFVVDVIYFENSPTGFAVAGGETECSWDEDCADGEICDGEYCIYIGGDDIGIECVDDTECGDEETCEEGFCFYGGEGEAESGGEGEGEVTYIDECDPETFPPNCYGGNYEKKYVTSCKETDTKPYLHKVATYCGADKVCEEVDGIAQCVGKVSGKVVENDVAEVHGETTVCTIGERKCIGSGEGSVAWICSEDESKWETQTCKYKCENGYCVDAGCSPESKLRCLGNLLQICSGEWTTMQICPYGCSEETENPACNLEPFCSDSDGGAIPNIKGITYGINEDIFLTTGEYVFEDKGDECGVIEVNGETISCECVIGETECTAPCDLIDYHCKGYFVEADLLSCEYGCMDGACISPENVLVSLVKEISLTLKSTAHAFFRFIRVPVSCSLETEKKDCLPTEYCSEFSTCELLCGNGVIEYDVGEVCDKGIPGVLDPVLDGKKCTDPEFEDKDGNPFTGGTLKCFSNCLAFDTSDCRTG